MKCTNNLKQLAIACHTYHDSLKYFPPGAQYFNNDFSNPWSCHYDKGSWLVFTLPYMEQDNLYKRFPYRDYFNSANPSDPLNDSVDLALAAGALPATLPYLRCPSDGDL